MKRKKITGAEINTDYESVEDIMEIQNKLSEMSISQENNIVLHLKLISQQLFNIQKDLQELGK